MFSKTTERAPEKREGEMPVERPAAPTQPASTFVTKTSAFVKESGKSGPSIIGADLTINGSVTSQGEVQVEGEVQGDVHCNSLVVGDKATISGGVVAEDVIIRGRVQGSVRAQRVTLQSTSHVEGDIHHATLSIEQGAYFEGQSRRSENPTAAPKGRVSPQGTIGVAVGVHEPGAQARRTATRPRSGIIRRYRLGRRPTWQRFAPP